MLSRRTNKNQVIAFTLLVGMSLFFMLPFLWMFSSSLKHESGIFPKSGEPPRWIPTTERFDSAGRRYVDYQGQEGIEAGRDETGRYLIEIGTETVTAWPEDVEVQQRLGFHWANYTEAFQTIDFIANLKNTLFLCSMVVLATLASCSLVGYSFAQLSWRGRDALFILVLATMMIPYQVTLIPLFAIYSKLGWVGSFKPLIVPALFGTPFFIFLFRQFFLSIPPDLTDAGRIDGCSELGIYARIILPLSKPVLATVALFTFLSTWGDFLNPLIFLQDDRQYTLSLALQQFQSQNRSAWGPLMAMSTVITVPVIVLFFLAQKTFIQGITVTGMKG
jgi:multiple sugar transport system permease protein